MYDLYIEVTDKEFKNKILGLLDTSDGLLVFNIENMLKDMGDLELLYEDIEIQENTIIFRNVYPHSSFYLGIYLSDLEINEDIQIVKSFKLVAHN